MRTPRAVLTDIGGVIVQDQWTVFATQLAPKNARIRAHVREILRSNSRDLDLGVITATQFVERVKDEADLSESVGDLRRIALGSSLVRIPENIQLLARLRSRSNLKLLAVTNVGEEVAAALEQRFHLSRLFDDFVRSCELGVVKPNPTFYRESIRQSGVPRSECLYLDDSLRFVRAARALGIRSEWIRRPDSLPRRLSLHIR